jgi:hypothetical protein
MLVLGTRLITERSKVLTACSRRERKESFEHSIVSSRLTTFRTSVVRIEVDVRTVLIRWNDSVMPVWKPDERGAGFAVLPPSASLSNDICETEH